MLQVASDCLSFYKNQETETRGLLRQVIDFAEIWVLLTILSPGEAPRVLEPDFTPKLRLRVERACVAVRERPAAGAELEWGDGAGAAALGTLPSGSEGKQFYIAWLKDRYGYNIARINEAYGTEATSFSDLSENNFSRVDRARPAVAEDDKLFLADLEEMLKQKVDEMFQACSPGMKTAWKRNRT